MSQKFHVSPVTGDFGPCKAKVRQCPVGGDAHHFNTEDEAYAESQKALMFKHGNFTVTSRSTEEQLVKSNGVLVRKGKVGSSNFVKGFSIKEGNNSYYDGSWEDLEKLVEKHFDDWEPGTGSVDGDVRLVNVPAENFYTSVVEITDENRHLVEEEVVPRMPGEKPVVSRFIKGIEKPPAKYAQIVIYRADVLAQDNDRTTMDEWEIVSINAQIDKYTPMTPATMLRNSNHEEGGTYREYTEKEWADAYAYWENHAFIKYEE